MAEQLTQCGVRLRELRSARGWTLEELAERSGLSKPFLSRLEAGDRRPSIAAVLTLARIYGVPVGALFDAPATSSSCVIVRGSEAPRHAGDGLSYISLSSRERFANLQPRIGSHISDHRKLQSSTLKQFLDTGHVTGRNRQNHRRSAFAKKINRVGVSSMPKINFGSQNRPRIETGFGQCHRKAALGDIVSRSYQPLFGPFN